jgi:mannose-6-phosphate isomerase-like protein (cupin superfamily)
MASHPLDALIAAPDHHSVLFENEWVRILDTRVRPGDQTPVHAHEWPAALYVLGTSDFLRRDSVGTILADSRERPPLADGQAIWIEPLPPHSVENIGSAELHIIAIEVKQS